jgi:putative ABC transport system ATP-binding protein
LNSQSIKEITVYNDLTSVMPVPALAERSAVAARNLTRRYGDGDTAVEAVRDVSLDIATGQFTAIMGPSGSGKSTLMHLLAGLDRPSEGTVEIAGEDITAMGDKQLTLLRRKHIGFVFQAFNLVPTLSAEENITLPLWIAGRKIDRAWVDSVITRVGLDDRRSHRPSQMSGGQQQRVAVARALVAEPTVLFADEPTGNLDSGSSAEVIALLREAATVYGQTIVMVTHDGVAAESADRVVYLADGRVEEIA